MPWPRTLSRIVILLPGLVVLGFSGTYSKGDTLSTGLRLWQKPDKLGRACASCHSPDGLDLAVFAYDSATLTRRATPHLGAADAEKLSQYIVALRRKYGIRKLFDPMKDRPFQPGGRTLPGQTPIDRDRAFGLLLPKFLPKFLGSRIGDLTQAKGALAEIRNLDVTKMPVGIALNRLSEDRFHGNDHASLAHWIPDLPPLPYSPALRRDQLDYLADPSEGHFMRLDADFTAGWNRQLQPVQAMALEKGRSLLLFQHEMRMRLTHRPSLLKRSVRSGPPDNPPANPLWEVGDLARIYTYSQAGGLGLPADLQAAKTGGPSLPAQMTSMRLPWLWIGWTLDPGLQRTSYEARTRSGDWFAELLLTDGPYITHLAVMLTKKLADDGYDPKAWASHNPQHVEINYSWLLRDENWRRFAPSEPHHRKIFQTFVANSFRMFVLLQNDEVNRTGVVYLREPTLQQLRGMRTAALAMDPSSAKLDSKLFDAAIESVSRARAISH